MTLRFDHVSDPVMGLMEVARVLKPGGKFRMIVELHAEPTACEPQVSRRRITINVPQAPGTKCIFRC